MKESLAMNYATKGIMQLRLLKKKKITKDAQLRNTNSRESEQRKFSTYKRAALIILFDRTLQCKSAQARATTRNIESKYFILFHERTLPPTFRKHAYNNTLISWHLDARARVQQPSRGQKEARNRPTMHAEYTNFTGYFKKLCITYAPFLSNLRGT